MKFKGDWGFWQVTLFVVFIYLLYIVANAYDILRRQH